MLANRPHSGFGSSYSPVNNLSVPEAAMRVNKVRFFKPIIQQGQWVVKKLDFNVDDYATIRARVVGQGFGYLYASFTDSEQTQLLAIKKVTAGFHDISFIVPYMVLPNFRIGVSSTIPTGYGIDLLDKEIQYKIRTNSLMMNQHKPMYESPGIGFAGFGALADQNINDTPRGGQDSVGNPYWDGDFQNFSWATHKYSGNRAVYTSSANVPEAYGEYHGYYANRCSLMMAKFDENDQFLGWDTIEGASGKLKVPTGVPLCMVMQFFVNNRKGEDKGNQDPRMAKDPYWIAAQDYQLDPSKIVLVEDQWRLSNIGADAYKDQSPRYDNKSGVIKQVSRRPVFTPYGGETWDSMASKVEWYDTSSGSWSTPSAHPPHIAMTNVHGFTKLIFRIPRQLSPETDKDIIAQLSAAGINYDYNTTKKCFPTSVKSLSNAPTTKAYGLLGRPNETDTFYEENGEWYYAPKTSLRLQLYFEYANHPKAGYTNNQRDGNETRGNPKPGKVPVVGASIAFSDVEKMARMNYPELMYAFYPSTGFVTGGRVYAIGRGLSTSAVACISTTRDKNPLNVYRTQVTNPDGSQIGTTEAARIAPKQLILSTDLLDTVNSVGEEKLQEHWQEKFGKPLDINFFKGNLLKDAVPERPHMYRVRDPDSGLYIEAPYQIMIFEIEPDYTGPAIFYTTVTDEKEVTVEGVAKIEKKTSLVITKPEGKPYARGKNESIFLNTRTPFGYVRHQEIDVVAEVTQQVELLDKGLSPEDALKVNELDNPPGDSTATLMEQEVQDQYITDMEVLRARQEGGGGSTAPAVVAKPATRKLVRLRDVLNPFPGNYIEEPISGLKGFSNSRDFYVEDVTSKWTAGSTGLGGIIDETVAPFIKEEIEDMYTGTKNFISKNAQLAVYVGLGTVAGYYVLKSARKFGASAPRLIQSEGKKLGMKWAGKKYKTYPVRATAARRRAHRRR